MDKLRKLSIGASAATLVAAVVMPAPAGAHSQLYGGDHGGCSSAFDGGAIVWQMEGTDNSETCHGHDEADVFTAKLGADSIYGYGGNDQIRGGGGSDILRGATGNDDITDNTGGDYDRVCDGGGYDFIDVDDGDGDDIIYKIIDGVEGESEDWLDDPGDETYQRETCPL